RLTAMSYTPDLHRFYHHAASTDIYTSSLHDALPISPLRRRQRLAPLRVFAIDRDGLQAELPPLDVDVVDFVDRRVLGHVDGLGRSEEHTSELQSREKLVCRLLLEKKKKNQMTNSIHL